MEEDRGESVSKRIKLTKNDILMFDNLLYFETLPDEYKVRITKIIKLSQGLPFLKVNNEKERFF